jgi:hypothetical protein
MVVGLALSYGCSRDARLADKRLRHPEVKAVTHYGVTLDEEASPKQVAYVLLRAIHDDFLAETDEQRQAALDVQFDLCAADALARRNPTGHTRDEFIYQVVYHWTPAVSHYVGDFETDWEKAQARMVTHESKPAGKPNDKAKRAMVFMPLEDPGGDANARVVLMVQLVKDKGYWRAEGLGFEPHYRSIPTRTTAGGQPGQGASDSGD